MKRFLPRALRRLIDDRLTAIAAPRRAPLPIASDVAETTLAAFELEVAAADAAIVVYRNGTPRAALVGVHPFRLGAQHVLTLAPGDAVRTPAIALGPDHVLVLHAAAAGPGSATVTLHVFLEAVDEKGRATDIPLAGLTIGTSPLADEQHVTLSLASHAGIRARLVLESRSTSPGATCHLAMLRVCPRLESGRMNAHRNYELRLRNEVQHFSGAAYTHAMYGASASPTSGERLEVRRAEIHAEGVAPFRHELESRADAVLASLLPHDQEAVFTFAMRCLGALLPMSPPNFVARAGAMRTGRPLRMLSICAGAARIEEGLLAQYDGPVALTLLDASPDLIGRAAERLQSTHGDVEVSCLIGDVNRGLPGTGTFDVIMCVSALHHVANLEGVLSAINARLADHGEFWSIGEQIGRNGNRLWPETKREADIAMATLPDRLRKNAHTGRIDPTLDDQDYSANSFEGIRSEELESMLEAYFIPEHVYKRNAFLWRLVDVTYADNYSLASAEDVAHLKRLVRMEAVHWATGGRSTELHGVYRKKRIGGAPST